jgi:hypothetical protein
MIKEQLSNEKLRHQNEFQMQFEDHIDKEQAKLLEM